MSVVTRTNMAAINAAYNLNTATLQFAQATSRISSGLRIQSPSDGPADYAIANRMATYQASLERLSIDTQTNRSLVQTANTGIDAIIKDLQKIRTLALESMSSSLTTSDRRANQTEVTSLLADITSIANTTFFNAKSLLNGTYASGKSSLIFQVGANTGNYITLNIRSMQSSALGLGSIAVSTITTATAALAKIDSAVTIATSQAASVGSVDERLANAGSLLDNQIELYEQAVGAIVDADLSQEIIKQAEAQILRAAGASALAQANLYPQDILSVILPGA